MLGNKYEIILILMSVNIDINCLFSEIKIGVKYIKDGKEMDYFPADMSKLEGIEVGGGH